MPKRIAVSDGSNVKEVNVVRVVQADEVKDVVKVIVIKDGIARQVWPPS